jgi:hypothetical protein
MDLPLCPQAVSNFSQLKEPNRPQSILLHLHKSTINLERSLIGIASTATRHECRRQNQCCDFSIHLPKFQHIE